MTTSEILTFLFSDIEASTRRWATSADEMAVALAHHDDALRRHIAQAGGQVLKHMGDGCLAVFTSPTSAVAAAAAAQREFHTGAIGGERIGPLSIRIGLHTGPASERDGDFFGPTLNRAARIADAGHGGQTLVSDATAVLLAGALPSDLALEDLGAHQLKDLPAPERLHQVVGNGLRASFPPLRTAAGSQGNVPVPRGRLVGRDDEVASLAGALGGEERIVTLTGVGGVGKTRLALAAAAACAARFPDGTWFVDLTQLGEPAALPRAVADGIGMAAGGSTEARDGIGRYLSTRRALLVLDNCEHLIDACADLVDAVLEAASEVVVLATSREPLAVEGERVWPVRSLASQGQGQERSAAETLFWERATKAGGVTARAGDRETVAEICRRLDGIPLAIELAAAHLRHFTAPQLLALLDDRFQLLTGGRRAQQRHQTLQATMDWSYGLLSPDEQSTLRALSVFSGGFTLEAAVAVAGSGQRSSVQTVAALVDKSLVEVDERSEEVRYRLLETVRLYARQRLVDEGEAEAASNRHSDWVLRWIEEHTSTAPDTSVVLRREADNVRSALEWAELSGRAEVVARLATAYSPVWVFEMRVDEGLRWLQSESMRATDLSMPLSARMLWRGSVAQLHNASVSTAGVAIADEAIELDPGGSEAAFQARLAKSQVLCYFDPAAGADALGPRPRRSDWRSVAWVYQHGLLLIMRARYDDAIEQLDQALNDPTIGPWLRAWCLTSKAMAHVMAARPTDAARDAELAAELAHGSSMWIQELSTTGVLAVARAHNDDISGARAALRTGLDLAERTYPHVNMSAGIPVIGAASITAAIGDEEGALELYEDVIGLGLHTRMELMFHYAGRSASRLRRQLGRDRRTTAPTRTERGIVEAARAIADASV